MKERPILFSGPMVRAILAGTKTQTRRVVKERHIDAAPPVHFFQYLRENCPYGQPGDRLWVRETWQGPLIDDLDAYRAEPSDYNKPEFCEYAADGGAAPEFITLDDELVRRWRPSIHMPRWASRILLEITSVRVERLHEISEADAQAEGVERVVVGSGWRRYCDPDSEEVGVPPCGDARRSFRSLWKYINGAESWNANPWVWVVEFKRVQP